MSDVTTARKSIRGSAAGMGASRAGHPAKAPTFTETARREQLIELTIGLIAGHGLRGITLPRIAAAAGITNAAVIYFFGTKNAVIEAACQRVLGEVVGTTSAAVEQASTARAGVDAYVRSLAGYLSAHPKQLRVIIEMASASRAGISSGDGMDARLASRWPPVAALIQAAQAAGDIRPLDARTTAIALIGAVDAIFAESMTDHDYDLLDAIEVVLEQFDRAVRP